MAKGQGQNNGFDTLGFLNLFIMADPDDVDSWFQLSKGIALSPSRDNDVTILEALEACDTPENQNALLLKWANEGRLKLEYKALGGGVQRTMK